MSYFLRKINNKKDLEFFRQVSQSVEKNDKELSTLIPAMFNIIYKHNGIGMAGVMAGVHKRVIVVDLQENNRKTPLVFINPEIIEKSDELVDSTEGSISIDNIKEVIQRYKTVKVKYFNEKFEEKIIEADGLMSICLQHEIDYLDGKLFIDYLPEEQKNDIINNIINTMKIKNIINDNDILRKKCEDVKIIDDNIKKTLDEMLEMMYKSRGIGLAANQVGINKNMVVIDLQENDSKNPLFLINPKITKKSEKMVDSEEGCLSVPQERATIKRHKAITVEYLDKEGKQNTLDADGLLAICIQHETDHLIGKVFIDYLSKLKKDIIVKKVKKHLISNE